ncbi:MAG: hypothetical protein J6B40_01665, partial [Oscillospiraceae bacterium]|nr:hypothetical protein [Oscillospiraceae bacterium]
KIARAKVKAQVKAKVKLFCGGANGVHGKSSFGFRCCQETLFELYSCLHRLVKAFSKDFRAI